MHATQDGCENGMYSGTTVTEYADHTLGRDNRAMLLYYVVHRNDRVVFRHLHCTLQPCHKLFGTEGNALSLTQRWLWANEKPSAR